MNRYLITIFCVLSALLSCNKAKSISSDLDSLEQRISALEDQVAAVNSNTIALKEFVDTNVIISSVDSINYGYRMTLNNGKVIEVIFGLEAPGIVPLIGVDTEGHWIMSIDGGKTFTRIEKADDPSSKFGHTPLVRVDEDSYWTISLDGGKTYERILNAENNPISAIDAREVAGKYAFFANVLVDRDKGVVSFNMITGETAVVPLYCASEVKVPLFVQGDRIFRGETIDYECSLVDVKDAYWIEVPKGWNAVLTDSKLSFSAPKVASGGKYTFELATVNANNMLRIHSFTLTLDDRIFFDDFDKGSTPDSRYWEAIPPKYSTGWYKYLTGNFDNATVKDGLLSLKSDKKGETFGAAGIRTKLYFGRCRIEVKARFSKLISSGVNHAIWLFPAPYSPEWPTGGEVDIVEHLNNSVYAYNNIHTNYTYNLNKDTDIQSKKNAINVSEFNTYAVELTEEAVIFYLNGVECHRYANKHLSDEAVKGQYPFYTSDFYLLMSPHLGTTWAGEVAADELPTIMEIDWVKITEL